MVRTAAFTFHDVVPVLERATSGFVETGAEHYKLSPAQFERHLNALAALGKSPSRLTDDAPSLRTRILLTFDDGGCSAATHVTPALGARGWPGHFFLTTAMIEKPGFVSRQQVREMRAAGHLVGSHSHTHPAMTRLPDAALAEECRCSREILEEILQEPVETIAIPGGFYSARVGRIASRAGYRWIFTSEPWTRPRRLGEAWVCGRFSVVDGTSPERIAAICRGDLLVRACEWSAWQARKAAKRAARPLYDAIRRRVLGRKERRAEVTARASGSRD